MHMLFDGQKVRKNLRGVIKVRQAVPHRHTAVLGEHLHIVLLEAAVFDAVIEAAEHLCGIFERFLFAHLAVGKEGHVCAFVKRGHLKSAAGAGGGFFKEQHDVPAFEQVAPDAGALLCLEVVRKVQQVADLGRGEILQGQQGTSFQIYGHGASISFA